MALSPKEERYQYYATVVGTVASLFVAIIALLLSIKVSLSETKIEKMDSLLNAVAQENKNLSSAVTILSAQSSKQDLLLVKLGSLQDSSGEQLKKLRLQLSKQSELIRVATVENSSIARQLKITEDQQAIDTKYRGMERKSDSIELSNAFDSIAIMQKNLIKGPINRNEYNLFEYLGFSPTMIYLENFKKIIDGEMKNRFLFSDDSLFIQWRTMRTWLQDFIVYSEIADDDPSEAGHFRNKPFQFARQTDFHNQYGNFIDVNNKKLHRKYFHIATTSDHRD